MFEARGGFIYIHIVGWLSAFTRNTCYVMFKVHGYVLPMEYCDGLSSMLGEYNMYFPSFSICRMGRRDYAAFIFYIFIVG